MSSFDLKGQLDTEDVLNMVKKYTVRTHGASSDSSSITSICALGEAMLSNPSLSRGCS
jgi:hypothetical protein